MGASDTQVGGDHYKAMGDFQPWDVLSKWLTPEEYRGYQKGVAIAYLARERSKGGDQDIRKAVHHLQRLVEELDAQAATEKADQHAEILTKFIDGVRFGAPAASPAADPLPIIDQPTDCANCCGQPNTCENPCFHGGQPKSDADGWITWNGGECPVPEGTPVAVKLRSGSVYEGAALEDLCMGPWQWRIGYEDRPGKPSNEDIIAYRIINPTT